MHRTNIMHELPTTQNERDAVASCFSGMQSRLASLLSGHRQPSTGAQRIPSAPTSPTAALGGNRPHDAENRARASAPYVPQHAAASFSKTATPRQMRRENEIL
ncbi:hypothetical protein F4802DRAFT_596815 [Xylaria palmicola]|nr:hypothetical protein F4802DRAFT_596815 [Xylaria palmicola]